MTLTRRGALIAGLSMAGALGLGRIWRGARPLEFSAMGRPAGYRRLVQAGTGGASGAGILLAGIDAAPEHAPIDDLCAALFQGARAEGAASIALFSDYRCPYCKVLDKRLLAMVDAAPERMRLHVHEWPALGPVSERMARLALAARAQGAWRGMHDLLIATPFVPSDGWIAQSAEKLSLSAERLLRDMHGPETERALAETAALAALFGFEGTPGLVIGRNVASGALSEDMLSKLVEDARETGPPPGCA